LPKINVLTVKLNTILLDLMLMIFFKNIFRIFWRIWFYGLVLFTIIGVFPVLLILTSTDKFYPAFFKLARAWAKTILFGMGFKVVIDEKEKIDSTKSYLFIANHTSMIDIMVMLAAVPNTFVFVGKKELANIPIFGFFYKRTCILVDRNNAKSRKNVYQSAQERLNKGISVCIFPEGKVPDDETIVLDKFQNGAFHLAIEYQIPIVPLIFYDCKKRFSYTFFSGQPGNLRVKINKFVQTKGLKLSDKNSLKESTYQLIYKELIIDQSSTKTENSLLSPIPLSVKTQNNEE